MGSSSEPNEALVAAVEAMLGDGRIEGLVTRLRKAYPNLWTEADAAVGHAVEKLIVRRSEPDDAFAYLAASSLNEMKRVGRLRAKHESLEALMESDDSAWEPQYDEWSVEERALIDATYKELTALVASWENNNVRTVTALYLEAAFLGEPLTSARAADEVSVLGGVPVSDDEVRVWKSRGFRRLQAYAVADRDRSEGGSA